MGSLWEAMLQHWLDREGSDPGGENAPSPTLAFAVRREAAASPGSAPRSEDGGPADLVTAIEVASGGPLMG